MVNHTFAPRHMEGHLFKWLPALGCVIARKCGTDIQIGYGLSGEPRSPRLVFNGLKQELLLVRGGDARGALERRGLPMPLL